MDDKKLRIIPQDAVDIIEERLVFCLDSIEPYDDYYANIAHQHLESALFFYKRWIETFGDV